MKNEKLINELKDEAIFSLDAWYTPEIRISNIDKFDSDLGIPEEKYNFSTIKYLVTKDIDKFLDFYEENNYTQIDYTDIKEELINVITKHLLKKHIDDISSNKLETGKSFTKAKFNYQLDLNKYQMKHIMTFESFCK